MLFGAEKGILNVSRLQAVTPQQSEADSDAPTLVAEPSDLDAYATKDVAGRVGLGQHYDF